MKKNNTYLSRMQAQQKAKQSHAVSFAVQQALDCAIIALNAAFGFGEERIKIFTDEFSKALTGYCNLVNSDARGDKEIAYAKAKLDAKLEQICGKNFVPWEERYGG